MTLEKRIFKSITPKHLPEEIVLQIETLILEGELSIGNELPSERELSTQLGVSRNILREAISQLKQKGLLETKSGSGSVIVSPKINFIQDSLNFMVKFNQHALIELAEARILIEVELAGRAAKRADDECVKLLFDCSDIMMQNKKNVLAYIDADILFHETLASAGGNEVLLMLLKSLRLAVYQKIEFLLKVQPTISDSSAQYHYQIAEAVQAHDEKKAKQMMRNHLEEILSGLHKFNSISENNNMEVGDE